MGDSKLGAIAQGVGKGLLWIGGGVVVVGAIALTAPVSVPALVVAGVGATAVGVGTSVAINTIDRQTSQYCAGQDPSLAKSLGAGALDTLGVGGAIEGFSEKDLLTRQPLSEEEAEQRLETGAQNLTLTAAVVYGGTQRLAAGKPAPPTSTPRINLLNTKVPTNTTASELVPLAESNAAARAAQAQPHTGPVQPNEVITLREANMRRVVGDNIEAHELWQHSNIQEQGLAQSRLSSPTSLGNPVITLEKPVHTAVTRAQPQNPRSQTPLTNITSNAQVLRDIGIPDSLVRRLEEMAIIHAFKSGKHY